MCVNIIITGIHANGGIFADGELNVETQKQQTLICLLALSAAGLLEKYSEVTKAAEKYLSGYSYSGFNFTKNSAEAKSVLKNIFGDEPIVLQGRPDLLTAGRFIWQNGSRHFC